MGNAATEEIDFSRTVANHPFMVKLFCMALLAGFLCCGSARSGVRMVDVVGDETFTRALETIGSQVKDSSSCKKVVKELNREADRMEKAWREAFMSGPDRKSVV